MAAWPKAREGPPSVHEAAVYSRPAASKAADQGNVQERQPSTKLFKFPHGQVRPKPGHARGFFFFFHL